MSKQYWKGVEELQNDAEFVRLKNNEFYEHLPLDEVIQKKSSDGATTPRRDFLKFLGFSVAAATLASCEAPVTKSIPYLIKPEEITPGIANWYASTYFDGYDYCSVVVKTRDGRPIKLEGNKLSSVTKGSVNARVQSSVLSLYDSGRLKTPMMYGNPSTWSEVDKTILEKLNAIVAKGGKIRILTSTVISPSTLKVFSDFAAKFPNTKNILYDAVSYSAIRESNKMSFGKNVIPTYHFEKAKTIVGIGADFLVNWLSPVEYASQYAETRKLNHGKKTMSRHIQVETALSVTGSNADKRIAVKPSQQGAVVANLYNAVAALAGAAQVPTGSAGDFQKDIEATAKELWASKGSSLVVCGINNTAIQNLVNAINSLLGNYGSTIDLDNDDRMRQGNDADVASLLDEMNKGEVGALFVYNSNPVYTLPNGKAFGAMLQKLDLAVSFADRSDETSGICQFICPDHHPLESWMDAEPKAGKYSLGQPTIAPLFSTRQVQDSFLLWSGSNSNFLDYMTAHWNSNILKGGTNWNKALQDGIYELPQKTTGSYKSNADLNAAATSLSGSTASGIELIVYEKTGIGTGIMSNNPWLQELPDPVSKITWDNYLTVSPKDARENGWRQGMVVSLGLADTKVNVPIVIQPGQAFGTVALALGYGRKSAGKVADNVGVNAFPFVSLKDNLLSYFSGGVEVQKTAADDHVFAATQTHHTMMGRAIVKETVFSEFKKDPNSGNRQLTYKKKIGKHEEIDVKPHELTLWREFEKGQHHWGLGIDLNSCIGCGACVVACTAENNVAVVGKDEVIRSREMHWMRIDRYYSSDADPKPGESGDNKAMEKPSDMPRVVFQPVMCQHCNHAPCETVCPVIATSHSSEGLNQMTYNRCVGTRYCANNCPYKVRRFNWFKYFDNPQFDFNMNDDLGKMVLNPDVVVRSRGVMEKCSMCVQRLQDGKLIAKKEGRKIADGELQTACSQTCPTKAITFGDYNDPSSELKRLWKPEERSYHLLEELNVQPNVYYQTKVRNISEGGVA